MSNTSAKKIFESLRKLNKPKKLNEGWDESSNEDREYIISLAPEGFREHLNNNLMIAGLNPEEMAILPYGDSLTSLELWDKDRESVYPYKHEGEPWADFVIKWTDKFGYLMDGPWNGYTEIEVGPDKNDDYGYYYFLESKPELKFKELSVDEVVKLMKEEDTDTDEEFYADPGVVNSIKEWVDDHNRKLKVLPEVKKTLKAMYQEYLKLPAEDREKLEYLHCAYDPWSY